MLSNIYVELLSFPAILLKNRKVKLYHRHTNTLIVMPVICKPAGKKSGRSLIKRENSIGLSRQPCFTLCDDGKTSDRTEPSHT